MIMNMVQSATTIDVKDMVMEGDSQVVGVGHPIIQFFALDQLRKKLTEVTSIATDMLVDMGRKHTPTEIKKKLDEIANINSYIKNDKNQAI